MILDVVNKLASSPGCKLWGGVQQLRLLPCCSLLPVLCFLFAEEPSRIICGVVGAEVELCHLNLCSWCLLDEAVPGPTPPPGGHQRAKQASHEPCHGSLDPAQRAISCRSLSCYARHVQNCHVSVRHQFG